MLILYSKIKNLSGGNIMRYLIVLLSFLLLAVSGVHAGPVVPADLDAQAVWYGHVDMETIMHQPLIKKSLDKAVAKQKNKKGSKRSFLKQAFIQMGIRLMNEFCSATMYATQYEGDYGVVLMKFKSELPKDNLIAIFAQRFPKHTEDQIGERKVYTWKMRCGPKKIKLSGCFVNDRQILIGSNLKHVENALEVLDGKRPAMAANHQLFKGLTPGMMFVSRAIEVPAEYQGYTFCPVLRHCNEAFARWTCLDNTIRGRYEFQTTGSEKAELYHKAIEGMKAMFTLRFGDLDQVKPLIDGFSNVQAGKAVILTWEGSPEQVKAAADQIRKQHKQNRKIRKQHNKK